MTNAFYANSEAPVTTIAPADYNYMTGSRAIIKINDKLFGFAFGVSYDIETSQTEIRTIDDYTAYELAPSMIRVSGTLSMFHIPGRGPGNELIQPNILAFLFHKYITIRIEDQTTGKILFQTNRAQITNRRQRLQAGEMSTIELTWKALGWQDEQEPFYPDGYDRPDNVIENATNILGPVFGIGGDLLNAGRNIGSAIRRLRG
jgi:hypothetical protein